PRRRHSPTTMMESNPESRPDGRELLRVAARWGPGLNGVQELPDDEARADLARRLEEAGLTPPGYLLRPREWRSREAKLFQAGDYPDKQVSVSADDLQRLAANFDLPVPIWVEHSSNPLEIGYVTQVRVEGENLMGRLALTSEAESLIESSSAKRLSVALSEDLERITEVSLVKSPRIPDARIFSSGPQVDELIDSWLKAGRLLPVQAPLVRSLLSVSARIFHEGSEAETAGLVRRFVELNPVHRLFDQTPAPIASSHPDLDPEAAAFYARHFPDLSLAEIAKRVGA
ncbi:MAG: hypothetical protein MH204_01145, partial [Fimbriimonadaceae bacterium]|nr:hypothetical protein [Fimbriimonadaceae bacterium]